jgi:molybdate transport system substrate-binding protein
MTRCMSVLLAAGIVAGLAGCGSRNEAAPGGKQQLTIYCAAGLRPAIDQIMAEFTAAHPEVAFTPLYGNTGEMFAQARTQETGDLYVAGDQLRMDEAVAAGMVTESKVMAYFKPVLVVPAGNPKHVAGLADLKRDDVRVALADHKAAVGLMADTILTRLGGYEQVMAKANRFGTVGQLCNVIATGTSADAGVVWDATAHQVNASGRKLDFIPAPELADEKMAVPIGLLKFSKNPALARQFIDLCLSAEGQKVFEDLKYNSRRQVEGN